MRDSVPSGSYSSVCNVLRQWQSRSSLLIESTDSMISMACGTGNEAPHDYAQRYSAVLLLVDVDP